MQKKRFFSLIGILIGMFLFVGIANARPAIVTVSALDAVSISASSSSTSDAINMSQYHSTGYFAGQITVTTGGTYKFEVLASADGTTFKTVQGQSEIITGVTTTSGPDSDGKLYVPFSVGAPARFIKIRATETGGVSGGTVTFLLQIASE